MKNNHNVITFLKNNYKVITSKSPFHKSTMPKQNNYNVITLLKGKYKVITKSIIYYIVITLLSPAYAVTFSSDLTDGQLAFGQADKDEILFVENNYLNIGKNYENLFQIPMTSDGRFVIGIPQDATELKLTVKYPTYSKIITFPVKSRKWDEEYVTGLPPAKVEPDTKNQARIADEALQMRQTRQISDYPNFPDIWKNPVPTYTRISSHFGSRRILNNVKKQGHSGTDLAAPTGTPIIAPLAGKVVFVHPDIFLTGQTVMIDHGFGVFSSYSHLSQTNVKLNQIVKTGDSIGLVGKTGRATGPHLHFTITWYGIRINPEDLIFSNNP